MAKFKVGDKFETTCIFTGGSHDYEVSAIKDNILCCKASYEELDGTHEVTEEFEIHEENGNEYIVLWEYNGHRGIYYAECAETESDDYKELDDPCFGCQAHSRYNCKHCVHGDDGHYDSPFDVYRVDELI